MSEDQEGRVPAPVVNRAALAGMAGDAKNAYTALRPGGKPPPRRTAAGKDACEITVRLKVVTPILGGGPRLRSVDGVDIIRVPTVRGHLRFWWRALYGHLYESAEELYKAESALWGRPADDKGGRSEVEVRIDVTTKAPPPDTSRISIGRVDGYALWPAREPHADRRPPGTKFTLTIIGPLQHQKSLENSIRAWILFGGYGGRTRRGLGSLTVDGEQKERSFWLPAVDADEDDADSVRSKIKGKFGFCPFSQRPAQSRQCDTTPLLAGASLFMRSPDEVATDAASAWHSALSWLSKFRQMRQPAGKIEPNRPSVSLWPEPDKIRQALTASLPPRGNWAHAPVHNDTPAWPRGGFGLPIIGKFQDRSRIKRQRTDRHGKPLYDHEGNPAYENIPWPELPDGHPNKGIEPKSFELRWRSDFGDPRKNGEHDRLSSPLILKPFPLANGKFIACALWLERQMPPNARIFLVGAPEREAPFDRLVAPGDVTRFSALRKKSSLRAAFCDWLVTPEDQRTPARAVGIAP